MLPRNLYLVRHGESEGNVVLDAAKRREPHLDTEALNKVPSSRWRLTGKGRGQAERTGVWLRDNGLRFDRYLVSDYARARETAALLGLREAEWLIDFYLRERERGHESTIMTAEERDRRFPESKAEKDRHKFYWRPLGGESIADLCQRVGRVFDALARKEAQSVIVVCHEEVMWAFRTRLEKLAPEQYLELDEDKTEKIENGGIYHYTRVDPKTSEEALHYTHRTKIDLTRPLSEQHYVEIQRKRYTNEELKSSLPPATLRPRGEAVDLIEDVPG